MLHFALCMSMYVCLEIKIFVFVFVFVMDMMTGLIREEAPWTMMFVDDIVICSKSKEHVEEKLDSWRYALERR